RGKNLTRSNKPISDETYQDQHNTKGEVDQDQPRTTSIKAKEEKQPDGTDKSSTKNLSKNDSTEKSIRPRSKERQESDGQ
ncbi:4873_t:CDS:2, partial [Gigaspora margarita]